MAGSEIIRILQKIREEEESAHRALEGPAMMGGHAFLNARTENIARWHDALAELVGSKDVAMELIAADQQERDGETTHVSL
jgi:hypothetical protein